MENQVELFINEVESILDYSFQGLIKEKNVFFFLFHGK